MVSRRLGYLEVMVRRERGSEEGAWEFKIYILEHAFVEEIEVVQE